MVFSINQVEVLALFCISHIVDQKTRDSYFQYTASFAACYRQVPVISSGFIQPGGGGGGGGGGRGAYKPDKKVF